MDVAGDCVFLDGQSATDERVFEDAQSATDECAFEDVFADAGDVLSARATKYFDAAGPIEDALDAVVAIADSPVAEGICAFEGVTDDPLPLWMRSAKDVTNEECSSFYHAFSGDSHDPLAVKHFAFSVARRLRFHVVSLIPRPGANERSEARATFRQYARSARIQGDCNELMPEWIRLVAGAVDFEEIDAGGAIEPLPRATLLRVIRRNLVSRCLDAFAELATKEQAQGQPLGASQCEYFGIGDDTSDEESSAQISRCSDAAISVADESSEEVLDVAPGEAPDENSSNENSEASCLSNDEVGVVGNADDTASEIDALLADHYCFS